MQSIYMLAAMSPILLILAHIAVRAELWQDRSNAVLTIACALALAMAFSI